MAVLPINISHSSTLNAICFITAPNFYITGESIIILMDTITNELWYKKNDEVFPFNCLSFKYTEQLYKMLKKDEDAWEALQHMEINEAVEMYTKVAYGDILSKMVMQFMN